MERCSFFQTKRFQTDRLLASTRYNRTKKEKPTLGDLSDAIEQIPNQVMFWDQNSRLIIANKQSRSFQKKYGFSMEPGVLRLDMRKNLINKGMMKEGETVTEEKERKSELKILKEKGYHERERVFTDGTALLFSDTLLPDGSVINFATDITERKKREETNRRLTDALDKFQWYVFWDTDGGLIQAAKKARNLWKRKGLI